MLGGQHFRGLSEFSWALSCMVRAGFLPSLSSKDCVKQRKLWSTQPVVFVC